VAPVDFDTELLKETIHEGEGDFAEPLDTAPIADFGCEEVVDCCCDKVELEKPEEVEFGLQWFGNGELCVGTELSLVK